MREIARIKRNLTRGYKVPSQATRRRRKREFDAMLEQTRREMNTPPLLVQALLSELEAMRGSK
jgi:hypothetical protein